MAAVDAADAVADDGGAVGMVPLSAGHADSAQALTTILHSSVLPPPPMLLVDGRASIGGTTLASDSCGLSESNTLSSVSNACRAWTLMISAWEISPPEASRRSSSSTCLIFFRSCRARAEGDVPPAPGEGGGEGEGEGGGEAEGEGEGGGDGEGEGEAEAEVG